ncbi:protein kinase domain-containing protein [Gimesia maris]|uniref:protein kinase domain-containing protein n=1 Tax=Gimesia maris TaxID=122 RepID=UPI0030DBEA7E|tara:strand:+ start:213166 stop:216735 length:3570 start_codon:yes stop_codon:yes gene_type:complete
MNEQEIFNEALEIDDVPSRSAFLDQVCGDDRLLRKQVDALLEEYARSGEFLRVPAVDQIRKASDVTRVASVEDSPLESDLDLSFLEPPTVEGSLGSLCHYDIQELIGRGGCGIVFKAFDQRLHRIVAIKVMTPAMAATSPARKRFLREARATAAIRHENVVNIYAVEEAPLPFLVMEYIDGKTLQQVLDENGPLELQTICRLGQMIANGLQAAHLQGLIHRDIKPANILIESGTGQVKLTDFGLARAADDASRSQSGIIAGTPLYMSPEQVQGVRLDQRSDLFSLGSVLYVMCTGRAPFRAPSTLAVLKRVVDEQPRNIQEVITEVPDWLVTIIQKLHEKEPEKRFTSAQEVADLLAGTHEEIALKIPPVEESPESSKRMRRGLFPWMKFAAVLIVLLSSFGFTEATGITNVRGTVIRLFSPEGTLVIEVDDPGVSISIDGQEMVITGAGVKELRLKPGQYQLQATKNGEVLQQELITVTRNGRQVVRVSREPAAQPTDSKVVDPDRRAAEYVLSIGGKVRLDDDSRQGEKKLIASIKELPDSPFRLTHVELINMKKVTDTGLAALRGTKNLRFVNLAYSPEFTDAGLAHLSDNRGLQRLDLWGTNITKQGLEYFTDFPDLRDLRLGDTQLSAEDLSILKRYASLQKLEMLMLSLTQADDSTLAILSGASQLGQLNLEQTNINDVGLEYLEQNRNLRNLYLNKTPVTTEGIRRLAQALPECDIDWSELKKTSTSNGRWTPDAGQQKFFDEVARMKATDQVVAVSQKLMEVNPGFDGKLKETIENGHVVGLSCNGGPHISAVWPVRALSRLTSFRCGGPHLTHGKLKDLSPLVGLPLTHLDVGNSSVSDLSPLRGMKLDHLYGAHTRIKDLSPLADMPLKVLFLWNSSQVSDLSPLKGMRLTNLNLDFTQVADLSPLQGMDLTHLAVHQTHVSSLLPLSGMPLQALYCSNTRISDLSPLKEAELTTLHIENTQVSDLSTLAGMPLKELSLERTLVSDLSPLAHMPLEQLTLSLPLFQEQDERLLFQLPLKRLGRDAHEIREAGDFWSQYAAQQSAAEAFASAYAQEPASVRTKAILGKLREDANGVGLVPVIEEGVVVEATLTLAPESHDISSLRMLNSLRKLTLKGGPPTLDLSPLNSLPIESLNCSPQQALRNRTTLTEITSLNTINGQPKLDFLQSILRNSKALTGN